MTWLSRLLHDQSGLRRRANRNDKGRMASARRRHRKPTLEAMEQRLVLAGGITIPVAGLFGGPLTIIGDTNGDNIPIRVDSAANGGRVTVGPTFINGVFQTVSTLFATTSIDIRLPGGGNNFPNTITIVGPGKNIPTALVQNLALGEDASAINIISPTTLAGVPIPPTAPNYPLVHNLNLSITGINASGALNVEELARGGPANGGTLNARVADSFFSSLEIEQTGCCPANVTLAGLRVPGRVEVYEGYANGNTITLATGATGPNVLGSTILQQWTPDADGTTPAPVPPDCVGRNDTICVQPGAVGPPVSGIHTVQDLTILQGGTGSGQQVVVDGLRVSANSFGVRVDQAGAAESDGRPAARAVVCNVTLIPGQFPNVPPIPAFFPGVEINQTGGGNYADVAGVVLPGEIEIEQNTDGGNYAEVLNSRIGLQLFGFFPPYIIDISGLIEISQDGNGGPPNTAILDRVTANNAVITQGNNPGPGDCFGPAPGSLVQINDTTVISDLTITQGYSDTADTGGNIVAIATVVRADDPGSTFAWRCPVGADCFDGYAATPVYAFDTDITQRGLGNTLYLGAGNVTSGFPTAPPTFNIDGFAFQTNYLDVYTGSGGATVYATYVNVIGGTDDFGIELPDADDDYDGEPLSGPFAGNGINFSSGGGFNVFYLNISTPGNPNSVNNFSLVFDQTFAYGFFAYGF
jgi:hypothetical protein